MEEEEEKEEEEEVEEASLSTGHINLPLRSLISLSHSRTPTYTTHMKYTSLCIYLYKRKGGKRWKEVEREVEGGGGGRPFLMAGIAVLGRQGLQVEGIVKVHFDNIFEFIEKSKARSNGNGERDKRVLR